MSRVRVGGGAQGKKIALCGCFLKKHSNIRIAVLYINVHITLQTGFQVVALLWSPLPILQKPL